MRQVAQNYRSGELCLLDVPVPACLPGGVLVRSRFSLISTGTELMKVSESQLSLVGKARARPDQVRQVVRSVSQQGLAATYQKVASRLDSYTPLGYSLCGEVIDVGDHVTGFEIGQRVACAGNLYALHAEYNWVPKNLCAPVPDGVSDQDAAYTTVGAIALHGFRRSEAALGEVACVVGLGLIGQLLVQILRSAGLHVVGVDPSADRCRLAERLGALACGPPEPSRTAALFRRLADIGAVGGADHVFLTAGGDTNQPVELAVTMARDRARVTDIGKCHLNLAWNDWYAKELDLRFSRSYGPGRYDSRYEEDGVDYPPAYVRWTEQRNLGAFLALVAAGRVDVGALTSRCVPFADAVRVYGDLSGGSGPGIGVLFRYDTAVPAATTTARLLPRPADGPPRPRATRAGARPVRLGVIGAGRYASSMLLPHLDRDPAVELVEVATASGLSARNALRKFAFARCSTDHHGLLAANDIDAVLIATRHHSHAPMVAAALRAGKAVFVEKPLALDGAGLAAVTAAVIEAGNDRLMVGFNRRFAPLLVGLRARFGNPGGPVQLRYEVNAGLLDPGSWYARRDEAGSRLVGEGCHFIDTASWWIGAQPSEVITRTTTAGPDDAVIAIAYADGSVATIGYCTGGDHRYPKEVLEVFGGGRVARLSNFRRADLFEGGRRHTERAWRGVDKGQRAELAAFVASVAGGRPMPIPLSSLFTTTETTLAAERSARSGRPEQVPYWVPDVAGGECDSPEAGVGR